MSRTTHPARTPRASTASWRSARAARRSSRHSSVDSSEAGARMHPQTTRRPGHGRLVAILALVAAAGAIPFLAVKLEPRGPDPWSLSGASLILTPDGGSASAEQPVELPDPWIRTHPEFQKTCRYRFGVAVPADATGDRVLYIPRNSNS